MQLNRVQQTNENFDLRLQIRRAIYDKAINYEEAYKNAIDKAVFMDCIKNLAEATGFRSVWVAVFKNHPIVIKIIFKS